MGHLSRERDGIAASGMSKTVVEQSHRAVSRSVGRDGRRMGMGEDGRQDRQNNRRRGGRQGEGRERGRGNTSCVKQVAGLLQLDGLKLPKVEISPSSSAHGVSAGRLWSSVEVI